jgi:PAS domain S-box-containing protein
MISRFMLAAGCSESQQMLSNRSSKPNRRVSISDISALLQVRKAGVGYALAVAAVAAAYGITMLTAGSQRTPVPFFTLAVLISAVYGGKRSGWLAAILSVLATTYLLTPRIYVAPTWNNAVRVVAFAAVAVSVVVLVSRMRAAAQELNSQREWLDVTLRSIGDAVIATDAQGAVTFMNPVAESTTGWRTTDVAGRPLHDVFRIQKQGTGEPLESPVAQVLRSGGVVGLTNNTVLIRKDGSNIIIDDCAAPIRDNRGVLTGAVLVFRDTTHQRYLEREREAVHEQQKRILASINEGFATLGRDLRYLYVNEQAVSLLGKQSRDEFIGRTLHEVFPEQSGNVFDAACRRALAERTPVRLTDYYPPLDAWFQVNAYPLSEGLTLLFQDVTQQVKSQHALQVSEKLAATGRLASTIAHEINNPLAAVTNLVYLAKRSGTVEKSREYLLSIEKELGRIAEIIRQTLGFVRATNTTTPSAILSEVLDNIVSAHTHRVVGKQIVIRKEYAADAANAVVPGEIRQVFANLISNAIDFLPTGGTLCLVIQPANEGERRQFLVQVRDNGVGITPEHLGKVFDPFFTTKKDVGTGLGLWVSKQILDKLGGSIRVESSVDERDHGTCFSVLIPEIETEKAKAARNGT